MCKKVVKTQIHTIDVGGSDISRNEYLLNSPFNENYKEVDYLYDDLEFLHQLVKQRHLYVCILKVTFNPDK